MDTEEFTKLIKTRRSIHTWQDKPVSEAQLLQAIELATWAPNGGNQQNWFFYVIMNKQVINSIADTVQSAMAMPRPTGGTPGGSPPGGTPRGDALRSAPALVIVTSRRTENPMDKALEERAETDPEAKIIVDGLKIVDSRIQSISAAIAYLLLALHQMGMGSLWMTGPLRSKAAIEKLLKIPQDLDIVALVPVGYAAESPVRDRKPVSEVCEIIR